MSRTKHTRPRSIIAVSRVHSPFEPRGKGDTRRRKRIARQLKESGLVVTPRSESDRSSAVRLPRITAAPNTRGYLHAVNADDIARLLLAIGPEHFYGLSEIRLSQADRRAQRSDLMGKLVVPGRILLFEQPVPPWRLSGKLGAADSQRFTEAGGMIEEENSGLHTIVHWDVCSLRNFMLFDVLLHEIGHHVLQHHKGKRSARVARSSDHERWARAFAHRLRAQLMERENLR